jgi:glycosyltransferase involved in cell wall biosynthesis
MTSLRVSIVMATCNGARYLRQQLDSFVDQTRMPDDLVVCDDASTDETMTILHAFAKDAPFEVRLLENAVRQGFVANFDRVLSHCTGDIVFLSDQDDVWLPEKLQAIIETMQRHPETMVVINDRIITDGNLVPSGRTTLGNIRALELDRSWLSAGCSTAVRRTFLDVLLPIPDSAHGHDGWISSLAFALGVCHVHEVPLQLFRRHDTNTSDSIASRRDRLSLLDIVLEYGLRDARAGWRRQIDLLDLYRNRLGERRAELARLGLADAGMQAEVGFAARRGAYLRRIESMSQPRWRRWPGILAGWREGRYRHFHGWKSALKDCLRRG